jgi:hypothetical protein
MAGPVSVRELTPTHTRLLRFAAAKPQDDAAIRRLLRENPMAGMIRLTFEREPAYFAGAELAGAREQTILATSGERVLCMGRCTERLCWVGGDVRRVGYLSELRLDRSARGRFDILRQGYRFFREQERAAPAELYFTSIAADNHHARRLFERGVPGLPTYRFVADFVTRVIPSPRLTAAPNSTFRHRTATAADTEAIVALLNEHGTRHDLAAHWTHARLASLAAHGLPLERFHLLLAGNRLLACAALWDQRAFRQTIVRGYGSLLRLTRPWLNLFARLTRRVELPPIGACVPHAFVSPVASVEDRSDLVLELIGRLGPEAARLGARLLTFGFGAADPRLAALRRKYAGREYQTRLYQVSWPGDSERPRLTPAGTAMPEAALL